MGRRSVGRAMPLFRRKRTEEAASEPVPAAPPRAPRFGGRGRRAPSTSPLASPAAPVEAGASPPPLPKPLVAPPTSLDTRPDYSECFVCGSTLEGKTCRTCRMTWVE